MIDKGLVIASPWIDKILSGEKTWEIRSKPNSRTGRIALCKKGGPIPATATIGKSIAITTNDFAKYYDKHRVTMDQLRQFYGDRPVYHAWPLSDVTLLDPPIPYTHPGGGSWVTLTKDNVKDYGKLSDQA